MKKTLLILALALSLNGFGQVVKDSIFSNRLDKYRYLSISLPPSYNKDTKRAFPLLLALDGDYLFDPILGTLKYGYYWDDLPEVILVGLNHTTDTERDEECKVDESTGLPEGIGESFYEFIGGELLPYLQKNLRIAPFKIVAGHDVTAGFMNFYLYKDNPIFNAYISLSPVMPLDMETHIPERMATFKNNMFYYVASADGDIKTIKDKIIALDTNFKAANISTVNYRFDDFKGCSHYSLVPFAIPSALYQFFSVYQPISTNEFQEKIVTLTSGYADYLKNKYELVEKALGMKMNIRVNDFKAIEAAIIKNKAFNEFEQLAQLSRKAYPKSMLADYHMARFYENNGDLKMAMKHYQNAFQLQEIGDLTKDMMMDKMEELKPQVKKK
ncbi:alpha/beta hydrolase [Flavobacterium sp. N1719]|uniref:alpha/beta hydrolase n=1 Tax=Flavobacterium sp. N1719 TaxID=2885633 RepID=UPI002223BCCA|nr:alpha/beta hydrolase-fold protein [Flavobacterium sp. N1719]